MPSRRGDTVHLRIALWVRKGMGEEAGNVQRFTSLATAAEELK